MSRLDKKKQKAIIRFCLARLKKRGGFAATPYLPPTIEDTYFGINVLCVLKAPFPKEETLSFLRSKGAHPLAPRLAFFLSFSLKLLGEEFKPLIQFSPPPELEDSFFLRLLGKKVKPQKPLSPEPTLKELFFYAHLKPRAAKRYLPYVLASQNPDGGFGFYPHTTSFLENAFFAVKYLALFGHPPRDPEGLKEYVMACFRQEAFARSPKGVPFLDATFYALEILHFISSYRPG